MFERVKESKQPSKATPRESLTALWQNKVFRSFLIVAGIAIIGAMGYGYTLWGRAVSSECEERPPPKLAIDELIEMKERLAAYQRDRSASAYLALSVEEFAFLVATKTDIVGDYKLTDQGLEARVMVPRGDGTCYNVDFLGLVDIHRGEVIVRPARLIVGSLDMTSWFQPEYRFKSSYFGGVAEETFDNITEIRFAKSEVHLKLHNRKKIW